MARVRDNGSLPRSRYSPRRKLESKISHIRWINRYQIYQIFPGTSTAVRNKGGDVRYSEVSARRGFTVLQI